MPSKSARSIALLLLRLTALVPASWQRRFPELHDAEEPDYDETPLTLALRLHEFDTAAVGCTR